MINIPFERLQIKSGGYGILDVAFVRDSDKAWAVGGGGTIFGSKDGGRTWQKDKVADDLPTNLYKIKFFGNKGYILGSNGVLLSTRAIHSSIHSRPRRPKSRVALKRGVHVACA